MRPLALVALGSLSAALLAGCTGSSSGPTPPTFAQPSAAAFTDGPCRTLADPVLSVGRDARRLGDGPTPPADVRASLKDAQDLLAASQESLQPPLAKPFGDLVVTIGLVRLRADGNTYEPSLGADLSKAYDAVVAACT